MTKNLTVILLLLSNISFAQVKLQPTQFDKFVNKPKIEWAAYASDTFNFDNADLNNIILTKMYKNEIKGTLPRESRNDSNPIKYLPMTELNSIFHFGFHIPIPIYDSLGNVVEQKRETPKIDTSKFTTTEVSQILYIEKGKLKSYIPFVTPTLPIFLTTGAYIGEGFYFSTCYNFKYCKKARKKSKLIFLSQTRKMIMLNPEQSTEKLKELYGKNLLETLWPQVLANKIDVFTISDNKKISPEELGNSQQYSQPTFVPLYDSTSNSRVYNFKVEAEPLDPKKITSIQLVQDWYYDARRNKISNIIREAYVYAKIWKGNVEAKEATPVFKMVFR